MKKKVWLNKAASFDEAQKFDTDYYLRFSSAERIEMVQALREAHFKSRGLYTGEDGKRLRRVFRIVKQA
jgi:hypothetical protein